MELLRALEGIRTPFLDTVIGLITRFGEETILIVVFCALYWCINKHMAYVMGFVFFLSSLAVQGLKIVFRWPRPWVYDPTFAPVGSTVNPATGLAEGGAIEAATGYAFPSGHTQNAAALLGSLGAQIKIRAVKFTLFGLALLVGFSRLYLGVHYLSDVLVSLAIAFALIWVAMKVITPEVVSVKRELAVALGIAGAAVLVVVIVILRYNGIFGEASEPHQLRDASRAAGAAMGFAIGMFVERNYIKFPTRARNIGFQILKFVIGLAVVLGLQEGLRVMGTALFPDALRYFFMVLWIVLVYPLIIKKFFPAKN
ncbi:MAG: phosphatase PAP2 family protein [Defluviitaleaceae bacterium]|nr:phosphatase PAP2 family protein [Defluviitaleaceae bacterium]MCL2238719.1 phosphatase PAP2 family protein [Defluviitaleaceae bacterium]